MTVEEFVKGMVVLDTIAEVERRKVRSSLVMYVEGTGKLKDFEVTQIMHNGTSIVLNCKTAEK